MIVLDRKNSFGFSNTVISVIDHTYVDESSVTEDTTVQDFNMLIPTVQAVGTTNVLEYYQPGDRSRYEKAHGKPNALKFGWGPDLIYDALNPELEKANVGIYTINLRGPSATMSNLICAMKYRVEPDVPYTDTDGSQYYKDANGQLTTTPSDGAEPISRDVLHVKFVTMNLDQCRKWQDIHSAMHDLYNVETADDEGYFTVPWFSIMYRGATAFANDVYFHLIPARAEYDGNMYYKVAMFDGTSMGTTDGVFSFDIDSGARFQTSYYMETQFNKYFPTMRYMSAEDGDDIVNLLNKYGYTLDDYLNGTTDEPSVQFPAMDPFNCSGFAITVDTGSINPQLTKAFCLAGGYDGDETRDELFEMFFKGEILEDLNSPLRYRINYIPDMNYNNATKSAIIELLNQRTRLTLTSVMLGDRDGFNSALIEHQSMYFMDLPGVRQLAKCQSPMRLNPYIRKTTTTPATYFDVLAMLRHFVKWGNYFQPFGGADARWDDGFIDDTMMYPPNKTDILNSLQTNRINVVMKDKRAGAYLADQQTSTTRLSDQTEFNNEILISCMLYDLIDLIHNNHFKFNEAEEVRQFDEAVKDCINKKYEPYSASITATVTRVGTVGQARYKNKITVEVDLKDISKFTDIDLVLVDE